LIGRLHQRKISLPFCTQAAASLFAIPTPNPVEPQQRLSHQQTLKTTTEAASVFTLTIFFYSLPIVFCS